MPVVDNAEARSDRGLVQPRIQLVWSAWDHGYRAYLPVKWSAGATVAELPVADVDGDCTSTVLAVGQGSVGNEYWNGLNSVGTGQTEMTLSDDDSGWLEIAAWYGVGYDEQVTTGPSVALADIEALLDGMEIMSPPGPGAGETPWHPSHGIEGGVPYGQQLAVEREGLKQQMYFDPAGRGRLRAATRKALGRA